MGVKYVINFKNGMKAFRSDICFGKLNRLPLPDVYPHGKTTATELSEYHRTINSSPETYSAQIKTLSLPLDVIFKYDGFVTQWSDPDLLPNLLTDHASVTADARKTAIKNTIKVFKELIDDIPFFAEVVTVHPIAKRVDVKTNAPGDQVMLVMFALRNLAQYDNSRVYLQCRQAGYRPLFCLYMSQMYTHVYDYDTPAGQTPYTKLQWRNGGESAFFNGRTFGKIAAASFISGDVTWFQNNFQEQGGYIRDSGLEQRERESNNGDYVFSESHRELRLSTVLGQGRERADVDQWTLDHCHGYCYFRKMVDVFSTPADLEGAENNCLTGAMYDTQHQMFKAASVTDANLVHTIIGEVADFFTEVGVDHSNYTY